MRVASIDIGTNTFRLLIGEFRDSKLKKIHIKRVITRLGGGFESGKVITKDAMERAISTLKRFSSVLKEYKVDIVRAVATSVVREALNGQEFVEKVKQETGIEVEVISGEEEALLTVIGVLSSVNVDSRFCVIFDVGGGSTEYACVDAKRKEVLWAKSTALGVVHLAERFLKTDIPLDTDIKALCEEVKSVLSRELPQALKESLESDLITLVGTAGTPTTLAAIELGLENYDPDMVNGFLLKKERVFSILSRLIKLPSSERLSIKGLERGREDVIIPGAIIVLKTMDWFSKDTVIVSDGGLLEGIAYSIVNLSN